MTVVEMSEYCYVPVTYIVRCCPWVKLLLDLKSVMSKYKISFIPHNPYWYANALVEWIAFHLIVEYKDKEFGRVYYG